MTWCDLLSLIFLLLFRRELQRSKHSERNQPHPNEYLVDLKEIEEEKRQAEQREKSEGAKNKNEKIKEKDASKFLP